MYYFAYGSNMDEEQMKKRCPNSVLIGRGFIPEYKICFPQIAITRELLGVAGIRKGDHKDWVHGLIYDLTSEDFELLNEFEGYDKNNIAKSSYFPEKVKCYEYSKKTLDYKINNPIEVIIYRSNLDKGFDYYVSDNYLLLLLKSMIKYELDSNYILDLINLAKTSKKPSLKVKWNKIKSARLITIIKVIFKTK